jgi:archaellum component FlaF (FlaF/FlaG flagellin family)
MFEVIFGFIAFLVLFGVLNSCSNSVYEAKKNAKELERLQEIIYGNHNKKSK